MRAGPLICMAALLASLLPADYAYASVRTEDSCLGGTLYRARSLILDSEKYPVTNYGNAFARYHDLNDYGQTTSEFINLIAAQVAAECGQRAVARLDMYNEWAGVLRDQTDEFFLRKDLPCQAWTLGLIRFQIASHAPTLALLAKRLGQRDPDIQHVDQLLQSWAARYNMKLPPLTAPDQAQRLLAKYVRLYDRASKRTPKGC